MPKNPNADETVIASASKQWNSLRVTIPAFIVSSMGLKKGDVLKWQLINRENGETYIKLINV